MILLFAKLTGLDEVAVRLILYAALVIAAGVAAFAVYQHIKGIGAAEVITTINQKNQEAGDAAQKGRDAVERRIDADPARGLCDAWTRDCAR